MENQIKQKQSGQVALIVLIVSAVVLTLGLSTSQRSVTDSKITTEEGLLKEAFNVAESGIEYYLGTGSTEYTDDGSNATAYVVPRNLASDATNVMEYSEETLRNSVLSFWMVAHNDNSSINWGSASNFLGGGVIEVCVNDSFAGGLLVNYFYADLARANYSVERSAYAISSSNYNNFSNPQGGTGSCGSGRRLVETITTGADQTPIMVTVKPLGNSARLALRTSDALPIQGQEISSTAIVGDQETGVRKTVRVLKRFEVPQFMLDAITSEADVLATN